MLSNAQVSATLNADTKTTLVFEQLFQQHYQRVYAILYRLLGNSADAEDAAQQVFIQLHRQGPRAFWQDEGQTAGWLYRTAVNTGYNTVRSRARRQRWLEKFQQLNPFDATTPGPAAQVEQADTQQMVRKILAGMKPRDAKLLLLRHSGLSYKELAVALNIAPGSVGSLLTRAERTFARQYQETFYGGPNDALN